MGNEEDTGWNDGVNYKAILCTKIPDLFLDKLVAKQYFSKFGKITRFILRPSRQSCTVTYETEDQAERAINNAGDFNGVTFTVEYADREEGHVQNTEEWVDAEVQAELAAMGQLRSSVSSQMVTRATPPTFATTMRAPLSAKTAVPKPSKVSQLPVSSKIQTKVNDGVCEELLALIRRPARNDEEKYRVLDARDKLMRLTRVKQTDITKAVSTKGTCPDMCPEKERLMREFQRQVSMFEMSDNSEEDVHISHRRAIKEYSRSSADQEAPLAHELRPEKVLKMTMLYMMHNILNLCDDPQVPIADWFHFVWDRTRSIRKDITQQELCSLGTVELVEQCARFHIHCAARLVAEDPSVFDKKINAENLTKCLQSLKYMYHDLRIKNILCSNEAEFRSYIILLNLGDSNFLWELKQLPEQIQKSDEIKRAIKFYNALQNNNFVRFFEMIRERQTSYLSSCILLGYFNKLRWRAMEVINKSHNWRKNTVVLPLKYLTKILGFEDAASAADYCRYHGLECDNDGVMLERLKKPDIEYCMDRALQLVESKRNVSVGECVCGHPLESADIFKRHVPQNSFDENGLLKTLGWKMDDQQKLKTKMQEKEQTLIEKSPSTAALALGTDSNIFKIPKVSSPAFTKQPQVKDTQLSSKSNDLIFGKNQYPDNKIPASKTITDFKFKLDQPFNADSRTLRSENTDQNKSTFTLPITEMKPPKMPTLFGNVGIRTADTNKTTFPISSANASTSSIPNFKFIDDEISKAANIPSTNNVAPEEEPIKFTFRPPIVASRNPSGCDTSIFSTDSEKSSLSKNIFIDAPTKNIFSTAAKETANLFQPQQFKKPIPVSNNSLFSISSAKSTDPEFNAAAEVSKHSTFDLLDKEQPQRPMIADSSDDEAKIVKMQKLEKEMYLQKRRAEEEQERQRLEAEKNRKKALEAIEQCAEREAKNVLEHVLMEQVSNIAEKEFGRYHAFEQSCKNVLNTLLDDTTSEEIGAIANEEYVTMCHKQKLLSRYFARWLSFLRKKQHQRALMETTPIWMTTDTREEQVAKLKHPNQNENLKMIKRYRQGEPCNFKLLLWQNPDMRCPTEKVNIFKLISSHMVRRNILRHGQLQTTKYFKLVLSLPGDTDELMGFESMCNKWLEKYIKGPEQEDDNDTAAYICAMDSNLALCVRKVTGVPPRNERDERVRNECDHADGIICFITAKNVHNTRKRVQYLFKLSKIQKSIPVCFVVYDGQFSDERELSEILEVESLVENGTVSAYRFCGCLQSKNEFSVAHHLGKALRFVARESSFCNTKADALEMQKFQPWLEIGLGDIWLLWEKSFQQNPVFAKVCCSPQYVVELYNEAVRRLREMASENLNDSPEFPVELRKFVPAADLDILYGIEYFPQNWKSPQRQTEISKLLSLLSLPDVDVPDSTEIQALHFWLVNYVSRCMPQNEEQALLASYEAIKAMTEQLNSADLQEFELADRIHLISFLPVIKAVAFIHIRTVVNCFIMDKAHHLPAEIIYRRQAFLDYQTMPWWLNYGMITAVKFDITHNKTQLDAETMGENADVAEDSPENLNEIIKQVEAFSHSVEMRICAATKIKANPKIVEVERNLEEMIDQFESSRRQTDFRCQELLKTINELERVADDTTAALQQASVDREERTLGMKQGQKRKHSSHMDSYEVEAIMARGFNISKKVEAYHDKKKLLGKTVLRDLMP